MRATAYPKCSHCGYEFDDEETWYGDHTVGHVDVGDCEDSELICPNDDCGKTFYVRCVHKIEFVQTDSDGDDI